VFTYVVLTAAKAGSLVLLLLFQDPNPEDPLNKEAAAKFQENPRQFESYVQRSIHYGAQIDSQYFPPCVS
jgi:ubiquitin-conjugating enzyme E2 M